MSLPVIRPAQEADLPELIRLSEMATYGVTSLPRNPSFLELKIKRSIKSFAEEPNMQQLQTYLFFLEWEGRVVGTSGIKAHIGINEPFYAYHVLYEKLVCPYLNIDRDARVLHLINARKKPSEIATLFLSQELGLKNMGKLLSLSRFLFVADFRDRFASTFIAELRGVNHEGISPFWQAIGKRFFHMEFPEADSLRTQHYQAVAELFPRYPLYFDLLPPDAQAVMGIPHANSIGALKILEKQGFKKSAYVDIFDGGPHLFAPTDTIEAVKTSTVAIVQALKSPLDTSLLAIISNRRLDFRTTLAPIELAEEGHITFHEDVARTLEIDIGDPVRYLIL